MRGICADQSGGGGPVRDTGGVHISAKVDYAVRALLALAAEEGRAVPAEALASVQQLPRQFLQNILNQLRRSGLVVSQRGPDGGYRLGRPPAEISVADVMRAVEGPLAEVRGGRPEAAVYTGSAEHLQEVWVAVRASLRSVLEHVTLAQVVSGDLPPEVRTLVADPDSWLPH
jgi:Rrf2 family protein